jgi:hypothetical protein
MVGTLVWLRWLGCAVALLLQLRAGVEVHVAHRVWGFSPAGA